MESQNYSLVTRNWGWVGLLLIVLTVAPQFLGDKLQDPAVQFFYGIWIGLVIAFFGTFIYQASKMYVARRR